MMVVPVDTSLEEGLGLAFVTEPYPGGWDLDLEEHMVTGMETGRHWLTPLTRTGCGIAQHTHSGEGSVSQS